MFKLNIQLLGGRGRRSGLGVGGPGVGFATAITRNYMSGKLPEIDGYPDFPDPDYSNYKLLSKDNFIKSTFSLMNYKRAEHKKTGFEYMKSLKLNPGVQYSTANSSQALGYVRYFVDDKDIIRVTTYNLNKADTRRMEYKVKTMLHEGYHAKNDGLPNYNDGLSIDKARFHEETRTEMTALYLANQLNGYNYVPSYTHEVVSAAAKYKRLDEYKHCKTLYDLGKIFYEDRMVKKSNPSYKELEEKFKNIKLDDNYYKVYYNEIRKNKDEYYEVCKNSLFNYEYFNKGFEKIYKSQFDSMIKKISSGNDFTFTDTESSLFVQCVAISMNDGGIL